MTKVMFFQLPECGQENLSRRVINGRETAKNRYPWMVSVQSVATTNNGTHTCTSLLTNSCGGSLITNRHVLTAASCLATGKGDDITFAKVDSLKIVLGAHTAADRQTRAGLPVKSFVVHEDYRPGVAKMSDDIAIIELGANVLFDGAYNPVCLPDFSDYEKGSLFLTGWGNQNENGRSSLRQHCSKSSHRNIAIEPASIITETFRLIRRRRSVPGMRGAAVRATQADLCPRVRTDTFIRSASRPTPGGAATWTKELAIQACTRG